MTSPEEPLAWLGEVAGRVRLLAQIWATVDLERALADLGRGTGPDRRFGSAFHVAEDPHLGARVLVLPGEGGGPPIALAEPSTEGRLAATLARHGEGRVGTYLEAPADLDVVRTIADAAQVRLSATLSGPFGRSVLVLGERFARWHVILVEPAAVPSPP